MKYKILIPGLVAGITFMVLLANNIDAKEKQRQEINAAPVIPEAVKAKNEEWAKYYPREYGSWRNTRQSDKVVDQIKEKPQLAVLWAGYPFSKDYNAPRGHFYAIQDNINTLRTGAPTDKNTGPLPTACWACKSPDVPRLIKRDGEMEFFTGKWAKYGGEIENPIGCANCHNNETMELEASIPWLDKGLKAAGRPSFAEASFQEKRSLVCAQCHSEYYFHKTPTADGKTAQVVTFPWKNGLTPEDMEKYYDDINFTDWTHKLSRAPMLKAQHPGYETASTGIHYQKGVSCADCHMPYTQEGAVKFTDHQIQSPLETMDRSCMTCHRESEEKLKGIVKTKYQRKEYLNTITMDNLAKAHLEAAKAWEVGASEKEMQEILLDLRHASWRWDYSIASHGAFFHAPEETLRVLASANDIAQQARIKLVGVLAAHGVSKYIAPDFSTKEKAQTLAGVDYKKFVAEKMHFKETLEKEWHKNAIEKGLLDPKARENIDKRSSYFDKK